MNDQACTHGYLHCRTCDEQRARVLDEASERLANPILRGVERGGLRYGQRPRAFALLPDVMISDEPQKMRQRAQGFAEAAEVRSWLGERPCSGRPDISGPEVLAASPALAELAVRHGVTVTGAREGMMGRVYVYYTTDDDHPCDAFQLGVCRRRSNVRPVHRRRPR